MILKFYAKIAAEAQSLALKAKNKTILGTHIQAAAKQVLPHEIATAALEKADKAIEDVKRFNEREAEEWVSDGVASRRFPWVGILLNLQISFSLSDNALKRCGSDHNFLSKIIFLLKTSIIFQN